MPRFDDTRFIRRDTSLVGQWWWTVDHSLLGTVVILVALGILLSVSASPFVATKIGFERFYFVKRHLFWVPLALMVMFATSLMSAQHLKTLSIVLFCGGVLALLGVLLMGHEVKGASRWLTIGGFSVQPSEFVKPAFAVVVGALLSGQHEERDLFGVKLALGLLAVVAVLTLAQPDMGMTFVLTAACLVQIFVAGMPLLWGAVAFVVGVVGLSAAYFWVPHVTRRIDAFFHPELGDPDQLYQIRQSLEAFHHGGWLGCGPGEGVIKRLVPDAHADFVFAVAGEEYGLLFCLFLVILFTFLVIRSLFLALKKQDLFTTFSVTGLAVQLGLQAFINMSTAIKLIPTKGMTLPFVSYGGSSMLAVGLSMGMILALTKRQHGLVEGLYAKE